MSKQLSLASFLPKRKQKKEFDFTSSWQKEAKFVPSNQEVEGPSPHSTAAMMRNSSVGSNNGIKMTPELMERLNETRSVRDRDLLAVDIGSKVFVFCLLSF